MLTISEDTRAARTQLSYPYIAQNPETGSFVLINEYSIFFLDDNDGFPTRTASNESLFTPYYGSVTIKNAG